VGFGDLVFNNKPSGAVRMTYAVGAEVAVGAVFAKVGSMVSAKATVQGTVHGAERMAQAGRLTEFETMLTRILASAKYTQADGATVFVRQVGGKFDVVIQNSAGRIVTVLKHIDNRALLRLIEKYGWH
jgi:hypothetical protein